jgi:NitT/TauT family transport system permease protein
MKHRNWAKSEVWAPIVAFGVFLLGWEMVILISGISPLILPSPGAVGQVLISRSVYLLGQSGVTAFEAILGLGLGSLTGLGLAILFSFSQVAQQALYPYAIAMKAIPLVALAPIIVTWFGSGLLSKALLAAIIAFFPVLVNAIEGLRSVDSEALELFQSWSASPWQVFVKLRVLSALPAIFAGLKVASSFAIVGAVVAEFVGAEQGIGHVIKSSSYYLETDLTFAAILFSALTGLALFTLVSTVEKKVVFWYPVPEKIPN